jgi:hypothetical protein
MLCAFSAACPRGPVAIGAGAKLLKQRITGPTIPPWATPRSVDFRYYLYSAQGNKELRVQASL